MQALGGDYSVLSSYTVLFPCDHELTKTSESIQSFPTSDLVWNTIWTHHNLDYDNMLNEWNEINIY